MLYARRLQASRQLASRFTPAPFFLRCRLALFLMRAIYKMRASSDVLVAREHGRANMGVRTWACEHGRASRKGTWLSLAVSCPEVSEKQGNEAMSQGGGARQKCACVAKRV